MSTELANVKEKSKEIDELYGDKKVRLANALVQAREKTSLLESKIEMLAMFKVGTDLGIRTKTDVSGKNYDVHYVTIPAREIKHLMGVYNSGSLYANIEAAAMEIKRKLYIYRDKDSDQFAMKSLYGDVVYHKGYLTIEYNPETEYLFLDLQDNFATIKLDIAFKFQTNGGFQLYKLLQSYAYNLPEPDLSQDQSEFRCLKLEYNLSELRLQLGYVNLDSPEIQKESQKVYPDADELSRLERKPKYKRWIDFYTRVLVPGIEEINRISDIYIVSIDKECSAHGKIDGAVIRIQRNKNYLLNHPKKKKDTKTAVVPEEKKISSDQLDDFVDDMRDFISENIKTRDLKAIAKAADYDIDKIRTAYEKAQKAGNIENIVGWIIAAIKNGYSDPVSKNDAGTGRKENRKPRNNFHNFSERDYDMDELEERLLKRQGQRKPKSI